MKKIIALLILCSMFLSIAGCNNSNSDFENDTMHEDNQKTNSEAEQVIGKEYGFDADEEVLVPKKTTVTEVVYEEVLPYLNDRIVVRQAGLYGIIDNQGNVVMPIDKPYIIQPLGMNAAVFVDNKKSGVLSLSGEVMIPAVYDGGKILSDDLILLQIVENDDLIINRVYSEKYGLDVEFPGIPNNWVVGDDFCAIGIGDFTEEERNIKIITFDGEVIDVFEFAPYEHYETDAKGFGLAFTRFMGAIYKTSDNNEYLVTQKLLIDEQGNIIVDLTNENSHFVFDEDNELCCSDEIIISEFTKTPDYTRNYTHYVFNLTSHEKEKIVALDKDTKVTDVMSNGYYEINTRTDYYGVMNDKYEIIVEPIYDSIFDGDIVNGYFPVMLNDCVGYVDDSGHLTVPPKVSISDLNSNGYFSYNYVVNDGSLIDPRTGELLPYQKAELLHDAHYENGIFQAILTDEKNGDKYKSFVTWDGPIVDHKFPNQKITISQDGKVAVYNKGTLYTIIELQ